MTPAELAKRLCGHMGHDDVDDVTALLAAAREEWQREALVLAADRAIAFYDLGFSPGQDEELRSAILSTAQPRPEAPESEFRQEMVMAFQALRRKHRDEGRTEWLDDAEADWVIAKLAEIERAEKWEKDWAANCGGMAEAPAGEDVLDFLAPIITSAELARVRALLTRAPRAESDFDRHEVDELSRMLNEQIGKTKEARARAEAAEVRGADLENVCREYDMVIANLKGQIARMDNPKLLENAWVEIRSRRHDELLEAEAERDRLKELNRFYVYKHNMENRRATAEARDARKLREENEALRALVQKATVTMTDFTSITAKEWTQKAEAILAPKGKTK